MLLGATVVVARIAGVAEFGSFALAIVVFQAGLLLRDAGLGQALIVMGGGRDAAPTWHAFLSVSAIGVGLAAVMALTADPILSLLGLPAGADQLRLLAVAFGVGSLGVVPNASLERQLRFEARAVIDILAYGSLAAIAVSGVIAGLGVEALAIGYIAQGAVQAGAGLVLAPPWRKGSGAGGGFGALVRYGGILWISALLSYVATNIDNTVVGRMGGADALGLYALSYTIGNTITISLAQVINRVALPYYARTSEDREATRGIVATVLPFSVAVAIVPAAAIIGVAPEIRDNLFSSGTTMLPLVLLTLYGVVRTLGVTMGTALNGIGLARIQVWSSALNVVVLVLCLVPGFLLAGTAGVAVVVLVALTASVVYIAGRLRAIVGVGLSFVWRPALALSVVTAMTLLPGGPPPLTLRIAVIVASTAFGVSWAISLARLPSGAHSQ
jgi:O-antigen/teichoic acid export membrane protein